MSLVWLLNQIVIAVAAAGLLCTAANYAYVAICYLLYRPRGARCDLFIEDSAAPLVAVQIPIYNEAAVVEQAARNAAALDWPRDRLHIQIIDGSTDETVEIAEAVVASLRKEGHDITHLRRDNLVGYKSGALTDGLANTKARIIAHLDADFRSPPDWLRRAVPVLLADSKAAFVQQRCEFRSREDNVITRVQQLQQDAHYIVEQAARHCRGVPMQANGTATVWRRAAIEGCGGWTSEALLEDLDLALRVYLHGWRGHLLLQPACVGEVPAQAGDWQRQQSRWSAGFLLVGRKLLPAVWCSALSLEAKLSTSLLILLQLFFPSIVLLVLALAVEIVLVGSVRPVIAPASTALALALCLLIAMTLPPYLSLRRGPLSRYASTFLSFPALMLRLAVVNSASIVSAGLGIKRAMDRTPKQGL